MLPIGDHAVSGLDILVRRDSPVLGFWRDDSEGPAAMVSVQDRDSFDAHELPSPFPPAKSPMSNDSRIPALLNVLAAPRHDWAPEDGLPATGVSPSSAYIVESPSITRQSPPPAFSHPQKLLGRSASEDNSMASDLSSSQSTRSPSLPTSLPDPSQFPDPYPVRPPRWQHGTSTPALSSAGSSSASTRSSAYTNSARSGDFGHVHVVGIDGEISVTGITQDDDAGTSSSMPGRPPLEGSRWSDYYANSVRSRSSSVGNNPPSDPGFRPLRATPSFDTGWQPVDERDEAGLGSEDETSDDDALSDEEGGAGEAEEEEESTRAMVVVEEGLGIIVRGDDMPIVKLQVKPGTTHLLIGSSTTPNSVPSFLNTSLPPIANTLLALDISANFLVALPPALASCTNLEELNIASNPIRALPEFLSRLTSLRVLIIDSTGISTLPDSLSALDRLHTLSFRRNKLHALPSWLCLLPALETLLVDDNPFQGPWKALMEPLLTKLPSSPLYPPSTPMFSLKSASLASTHADTDAEDVLDLPWPDGDNQQVAQEDEDTITAPRAPHLARSITAPVPGPSDVPAPSLSRTRTTPNRTYYEKTRAANRSAMASPGSSRPPSSKGRQEVEGGGEKEVRKMKSAGELRRNRSNTTDPTSKSATSTPQRAALSEYVTSASSSNLLNAASLPRDSQVVPKRFASLGVASGSTSPNAARTRITKDNSFWDNTPVEDEDGEVPALPSMPMPRRATLPSKHPEAPRPRDEGQALADLPSPPKEEKTRRWGFLKKMSMGKMRPEPSPRLPPSLSRQATANARPALSRAASTNPGLIPQINVRISTTGALLSNNHALPPLPTEESLPTIAQEPAPDDPPPRVPQKPTLDTQRLSEFSPTSPSSPNLLAATPTSRGAKRRSFLPIDVHPIPIPAASNFVGGVTATNDGEDNLEVSSPVAVTTDTLEQSQHREEERQREARIRALRSVIAYLRDMHDLSLSQAPPLPVPVEPQSGARSRRPTMVENGRVPSETSVPSLVSSSSRPPSRPDSSAGLRSVDSRIGLCSAYTTQTNSVATTDSNGSGEERKYKDDRGKRCRIIREIVETERTYVKGLQELVDIYIAPAATPINVLSGVSQKQETVVPAQERKVVFGGLEALHVFHKDSFLPALERVAAPLLIPSEDLMLKDADGYLSLDVATKVAQVFVSYAAFMKMYSTYINNFDNSVHRIKMWTSDRPGTLAGQTLSPSSSSAQLVGLGLTTMAAAAPGAVVDNIPSPTASLSSGQKKRIKAYLKRCRMSPRHSQLNLEGYLLLPVQRIPRYRLLLEDLVRSSPPMYDYLDDPLQHALDEISSLATNMNEGKRESESRRRLVQWQSRIRGKFPSPLVQPHRRLIMDGRLQLTRVVRKTTVSFEIIDSHGDASDVQVECLAPELTPRSLVGILCNDLLVLCRDPSDGQDPNSSVDLWAVLRMQTLPQPASIVHGNALRLVDNKAILYFEAPSTSDALTWFRAINLHIPASKA